MSDDLRGGVNPVRITRTEWHTEGERLFGPDETTWCFACPMCGHVATVADFRAFKDNGAGPGSAAQECIGRYTLGKDANIVKQRKTGGPCDWASYGLFKIGGKNEVVLDGGKVIQVFDFAPAGHRAKPAEVQA